MRFEFVGQSSLIMDQDTNLHLPSIFLNDPKQQPKTMMSKYKPKESHSQSVRFPGSYLP